MKYLKKFNERLSSNTIKSAARKAELFNQKKRSDNLMDYSDKKEFGVYNINLLKTFNSTLIENLEFTEVTFDNIIYGLPTNYSKNTNNPEECVKNWGNHDLAVTFDVCFKLTSNAKKDLTKDLTPLKIKNIHNLSEFKLPLFKMSVILGTRFYEYCEECRGEGSFECPECDGDGQEYYNGGNDHRDCERCETTGIIDCDACNGTGGLDTKIDITERYHKEKCFILNIYPSTTENGQEYIGIFADRKNVRKFQKDLPNIFSKSELKNKIMDILSILQADSEDLDNVDELFNNISINSLLPDSNFNGSDASYDGYAAGKMIKNIKGTTINRITT